MERRFLYRALILALLSKSKERKGNETSLGPLLRATYAGSTNLVGGTKEYSSTGCLSPSYKVEKDEKEITQRR